MTRGQVFVHEELVLRRSKDRRSGGERGFHLLDVSLRDALDVVHSETSIESLDELLALCHGDLDRRYAVFRGGRAGTEERLRRRARSLRWRRARRRFVRRTAHGRVRGFMDRRGRHQFASHAEPQGDSECEYDCITESFVTL